MEASLEQRYLNDFRNLLPSPDWLAANQGQPMPYTCTPC
jgi:hypothetical protein